MASVSKHRVGVFVRIKPIDNFASESIELLPATNSLNIHTRKEKHRGYINNQVLDWHFATDGVLHNASQEEVYTKCASRLVKLTLNGYNNTLFAYGQTGSGKTYTMTGTTGNFQHRGIIPRAISQLYKDIDERLEFDITVRISYLEIYKDNMYDLLGTLNGAESGNNLTITEDDQGMTYVKGLACHVAKSEEEALNLLFEGETNRTVSEHLLNRRSSRSHCIFTIYCESHSRTQSDTRYTTSKFNFVDLAGSERLSKSQSEGKTEEEARYINKSLTFLEQTVIALEDKKRNHVPYRQNTLTHLLKDSLGGKCSTVMIGNIWGEEAQLEETLSTLRFASRVMNIPSQPAVNSHHNPILLCKQYEKEISILRKELAMYDTLTNRNQVNYEPLSDVQVKDVQQQIRRYVENDIPEIDVVNLRQVKEVFAQFKVMVNILEADMETKLKEASTSIKVQEPSQKVAEKVTALNTAKTSLVGVSDGSSFNVGKSTKTTAQPSAIATARKKTKKRRDSNSLGADTSQNRPLSDIRQTPSNLGAVAETIFEPEAVRPASPERSHSPPTKQFAFTIFKSEQGKDLNRLFQENKELLSNKKREAKEVSININKIKKEIDEKKLKLDKINEEKEKEDSIGEVFLDEDQFELITSLKSLKNSYRSKYEYLQNLRSDFCYCENMVRMSREKLLLEFELWYSESFGVSPSPVTDKPEVVDNYLTRASPKDEGEKFENVQKELLMEFPESVAFYNARINTDRRKLYNRSLKERSALPTINTNLPTTLVTS